MGSSNEARGGLVDRSSGHVDDIFIDWFPLCVKELMAGGAAGAIAKTAVAPLERTKILLQARTEGFYSIGVYQSMKKILNHEGIRGLYKGNTATIIRIVPYSALHYTTYEHYRSWILQNYPTFGTGPLIDLVAGAASGGTAILCTYPLDLARTKLAYQVVDRKQIFTNGFRSCIHSRPAYDGLQDVFRKVYKEGGIRAFYRGIGPTLVGILPPYTGLKFYTYELLKTEVTEQRQNSIGLYLTFGAFAGVFGSTCTYPLEVVRRRMQVDYLQQGEARYSSTIQGLTSIIRNQGWRQLYAGLSLNYMKVISWNSFATA
ncbi:unnamed protein product [Dovyalis caffra]|uniref:Mitochondrial carrier protein n=1 Tax=Dovyalis caffra TaxID=77055 RepID=A0AAV1SVN2_9ROSI|nr:unnamed protein product [Dovyalis caffra]